MMGQWSLHHFLWVALIVVIDPGSHTDPVFTVYIGLSISEKYIAQIFQKFTKTIFISTKFVCIPEPKLILIYYKTTSDSIEIDKIILIRNTGYHNTT